jgi:hypothetical protein
VADVKFVLLHDGRNEDGARLFFMDVWELYVKVSPGPVRRPGPVLKCTVALCIADGDESIPLCAHGHPESGVRQQTQSEC